MFSVSFGFFFALGLRTLAGLGGVLPVFGASVFGFFDNLARFLGDGPHLLHLLGRVYP